MKIEIFDVEHGQCSMVTCPNGKRILIDCGSNTSTGWKPSDQFKGADIELLIVTNYDRDHTSDYIGVQENCNVRYERGNRSITSAALADMKKAYGMAPGIAAIYENLKDLENPSSGRNWGHADLGQVKVTSFSVPYPYFTDANNLSVASFIEFGEFIILFPGDLETQGWDEIMKQAGFKELLQRTTILVAAHHGRRNGLSENAFQFMTPHAVIEPPPIKESISGVNPDKLWATLRRHINGTEALYGGADYRIFAAG